jgi:hypothetical protein
MTRVASHFTFFSPDQILRQSVVEIDDHQVLTAVFSLESQQVESAQTLFYDGIISKGVVSLKQQISPTNIPDLVAGYQYIDLSTRPLRDVIHPSPMPLILDFGTSVPEELNPLLQFYFPLLKQFTMFEIIAATVYYPALLMGLECSLKVGISNALILWKGVDLVNKKQTQTTAIVEI